MAGIVEAELTKDLEQIMADAGYGDDQVCSPPWICACCQLIEYQKFPHAFSECAAHIHPHTFKLRAGVGDNPGGPWAEGGADVRVHAWSNTRVTQGADPEGARSSYSA